MATDINTRVTNRLANDLVKTINRSLAAQQKASKILALRVLGKDITLERFFLNHADYEAIMGDTSKIVDRMVLHAICSELADSIHQAISNMPNMVGVWDIFTIYNVTAAAINFMTNEDTGEIYLTYQQYKSATSEEIAKFPENSVIAFSTYTPNKFYAMRYGLINYVLETIINIVNASLPKLLFGSEKTNVEWKRFFEFVRAYGGFPDLMDLYHLGIESTVPATEDLAREFCKQVEQPMLETFSAMLTESGLNPNIIKLMLGTSKLHILFGDPEDKPLGDVTLDIRLVSRLDKKLSVCYSSTIGAELAVRGTAMSKTSAERYGKNMRTFITNLCTYTINVYMAQIRNAAEQNMNTGESNQV